MSMPPQGPTPREQLAQAIQEAQDTWVVKDYPWTPAQVPKGSAAVAVWRSDLDPGKTALELDHTLTVNLYLPKTDGAAAEAEGDNALDELLLTLQRLGGVSWSKCERTTFEKVFSGWQITCRVTSHNVYRQVVLAESSAA